MNFLATLCWFHPSHGRPGALSTVSKERLGRGWWFWKIPTTLHQLEKLLLTLDIQTPYLSKVRLDVYRVIYVFTTVDCWNPAPVEGTVLCHYLQGLEYIPSGCLGFLPSTVWATECGCFFDLVNTFVLRSRISMSYVVWPMWCNLWFVASPLTKRWGSQEKTGIQTPG